MPFKFAQFCDYLETLEEITCHDPPLLPQELRTRLYRANNAWFAPHRRAIDDLDEKGASALLSAFFPLKRKDRVYSLQSASLTKLLGRSLNLGASARQDLASFKIPGNGDLGECLQRLLGTGGPPAIPPVSVDDVDEMFHHLAGKSRFSTPTVQRSFRLSGTSHDPLKGILLHLQPMEAKWLVRLMMKDLSPISVDEPLVLRSFHFLLPDLLRLQNDLDAAYFSLKSSFGKFPSQPDPQSRRILRQMVGSSLRPLPGVKVSRSDFVKARSIKHCLQLTAGRKWLVERKYDGEYCQIHVDLSKGEDWLKIYSKSGRDSTEDRVGLRDTLRKCLRIGTPRCKIKSHAILVGEMVVFSDVEDQILGFDVIRKHVSRAGVFLASDQDSPARQGEHLMILFFDLLLLDDEMLLSRSVEDRKGTLNSIYKRIHGRAAPAESRVLNFGDSNAERQLLDQFAASNARRHEGLVLKPCGVPYLPLVSAETGDCSLISTAVIKLKKDYIIGLGDEADFAVLGASYSAQEAKKRPNLRLRFTHFHLGCLTNRLVQDSDLKPRFKFVATIAYDQCMSTDILERINEEGHFLAEPYTTGSPAFEIEAEQNFRMEWYFRDPRVFEVLGSSYCKPAGIGFMLRHPRVKKVHRDRTWRDCISFDELQKAAAEALDGPQDSESQENLDWIEKLERNHKKKLDRQSLNTTPRSSVTGITPQSTRSNVDRLRVGRNNMIPRQTGDEGGLRSHLESGAKRKVLPVFGDENAPLPTPPESSPFCEGSSTRLVTSRKRDADDGGDMSSKRNCVKFVSGSSSVCSSPLQSRKRHVDRGRCQALSDVTLCPPQRTESSIRTGVSRRSRGAEPGTCKFQHAKAQSQQSMCALRGSVVHVYGLIGAERDRIHGMALGHGAVVIEDMKYWERDKRIYEHLSDTVGESQSYTGLRKMILIDGSNGEQTRACIAQIEGLGVRGLLEMYDYRLSRAMCSADAGQFWVGSREGPGTDKANG